MNEATTSSSISAGSTATHEEISRHAQELWEKHGRPTGRDEEIWLEAERELQARQEPAPQPAAASETRSPTAAPPAPAQPARPSAASATARMPGGSRGTGRKR